MCFYHWGCIILCYVDDCVLLSIDTKKNDFIVKYLIDGPKNYLLIDKGGRGVGNPAGAARAEEETGV